MPSQPQPGPGGHRVELSPLVFELLGSRGQRVTVRRLPGEWVCSCESFQYRLRPLGQHCKHINRCRLALAEDREVLAEHLGEPVL